MYWGGGAMGVVYVYWRCVGWDGRAGSGVILVGELKVVGL